MMFRDLHEIVSAGVREEINPFFGIEGIGGEILDEIVVGVVWAVGGKVVLVGFL